ncbi:hypothetical protein ABL78_3068 [Leptomonas seymouri]|uniref:Smr domain-containing protein n=1 Tax=Leptomonas seymouri TaxID=5684 RepID=A0A0N1PE15_LEPSE|nr:hypothetical protein ABL78_3068 [Leptomonas seymouri]|eukprot:KPI87841.1 hypothetical protein ABL78_3068 [Leptomonas seymouri]
MGRGDRDDRVQELMAKGFGKAKCTQALKDAGNNMQLALRILDRTKQLELQHARPHSGNSAPAVHSGQTECDGAPCSVPSAAASIPSLHRSQKRPASAFPLTDIQKKLLRQRERRHPCVVQYGCCHYGEFCLLKDLPGDVCVHHFHGCCIYGPSCRHRHYVDGVDVREVLRDAHAGEAAALQVINKDGVTYCVPEECVDAKVRIAALAEREDCCTGAPQDAGASSPQSVRCGHPLTHASSHADPHWPVSSAEEGEDTDDDDGFRDAEGPSAAVHHPTPFLECVRAAAASASTNNACTTTNNGIGGHSGSAAVKGGSARATRRRRHPCIAQYGSCKFGDACLHADRDADVCVHFLNGHCRLSAAVCPYRHESVEEYQQALRARSGLDSPLRRRDAAETSRASLSPAPTAANSTAAHATRSRNPLQNEAMAHGDGRNDKGGNGGWTDAASLPQASPVTAAASPLSSLEDVSASTATSSEEHSLQTDFEAGAASSFGDTEMNAFLGLLEVFPDVEPSVVLQVLRLYDGDPIKVCDILGGSGSPLSSTEVEDLAAALALAAAEEATEHEAEQDARVEERHNSLLTLVMLFPFVEESAVEAVLSQNKGDFAAAYDVLLSAQERMVRAAAWRGTGTSTALSPVDQLRVEKLSRMFPGLHQDIVQSAYCSTGRDWSSTTTALNELTKEMLGLEATEVPTRPVARRPLTSQAAVAKKTNDSDGAHASAALSPTVEETSEEVYEAYRAAEREILIYGDWRRVRQQAYLINKQRIRVLGQASAAFHQGDGGLAKLLSREGHRMAIEYNRLNRMAMLALEQERLRTDSRSTLDLHGFHVAEVHDVVVRRVEVCRQKKVEQLRIVVGVGLHSKQGHCALYTVLMEELRTDPYLKSVTKVKSVKTGYVDIAVIFVKDP